MDFLYRYKAWLCLLLLLLVFEPVAAGKRHVSNGLDSLMQAVYKVAQAHDQAVRHYESDLYIKGRVRPLKTNQLIQSVPQTMRFDRNTDDYIFESISELNYTAPWIFDRKVLAVNGTFPQMKKESDDLIQYFNIRIYKETMIGDHLLSPFLKQNARFYTYSLDSIRGDYYHISFRPRYHNTQLVEGHFVLEKKLLMVRELFISGYFEFMKFSLQVAMGEWGYEMLLPQRYELKYLFNYVGNRIQGEYTCVQRYKKLEMVGHKLPQRKHRHDITDRYRLQVDTAEFRVDSALVARNRLLPLTAEEQQLYDAYALRTDSLKRLGRPMRKASVQFWRQLGEAFVADYGWRFAHNQERIKLSPILNPILLDYSKSRGYAYRLDLRYTADKPSGRYVRIAPRVGYNFTFREWNWRVNASYTYWPRTLGAIEVEAGSGRRIYSDSVLEEVKKSLGESIDYDKLHLDVFTESYLKLKHKIELLNGLDLSTGVIWYRRVQTKKPEIILQDVNIKNHYSSFAVNVRLDYTPGQYYYWRRNRKVDVYSPFPTFSIDWEHGFPDVFGSNGMYDRWEVEMNYSYKTNVFNRISYQLGTGIFTRQSTIYFADFYNFRHSHLPQGWDDELSGTFQTLRGKWYNSADRYLRGHITYESPLLALTRLYRVAHAVQAERLYLSGLIMPKLHPYLEAGYGFTTHVFDFGFFVSAMNWRYNSVGCKFTFELFR